MGIPFAGLYDLQKTNVCVNVRMICDDGEANIHLQALTMYGDTAVWWAGLMEDTETNLVLLPGVLLTEIETFVATIYGQNCDISNEQFTVIDSIAECTDDQRNNNTISDEEVKHMHMMFCRKTPCKIYRNLQKFILTI